MIPGGRMNPRMLQQMMKQLGIQVEEIDGVTRVVIETPTKDYVFSNPAVSAMKAQGSTTYQVQGEPQVVPKGGTAARHPAETGAGVVVSPKPGEPPKPLYTDEDVRMVMEAAGVPRDKAKKALEDTEGEVATAIVKLTGG